MPPLLLAYLHKKALDSFLFVASSVYLDCIFPYRESPPQPSSKARWSWGFQRQLYELRELFFFKKI